jgi:hypothetical protein
MTRILTATIAVFVSSLVQGDRDVRVLVAGETVERSLDSGERHTYQVALRAGELRRSQWSSGDLMWPW